MSTTANCDVVIARDKDQGNTVVGRLDDDDDDDDDDENNGGDDYY